MDIYTQHAGREFSVCEHSLNTVVKGKSLMLSKHACIGHGRNTGSDVCTDTTVQLTLQCNCHYSATDTTVQLS